MRLHYVEYSLDNAISLRDRTRREGDIGIDLSTSLDELLRQANADEIDAVLIDINRPDAVSIEDDVARLRTRLMVPVAFVTGGDASKLRPRAINAGARAVLDKATLTVDAILDVFEEAVSEVDDPLADIVPSASLPNAALKNLLGPLRVVEESLSMLTDTFDGMGTRVGADCARDAYEIARALSLFGAADTRAIVPIDLLSAVKGGIASVEALAAEKEITFQCSGEKIRYGQIGDASLSASGMHHLLKAVCLEVPARSKVSVFVEKGANGPVLSVFLPRKTLNTVELLFDSDGADLGVHPVSAGSFRIAALSLGIGPSQAVLRSHDAVEQLSLSL